MTSSPDKKSRLAADAGHDQELASFIQRITTLPTLSPILQRINGIMANPESSAADLVSALKLDPAIAGKVLRLANSAYVGIPRTVSSLHNAVVLLGQKRVHSLVTATTVLSSFSLAPSRCPLNLKNYWQHCFAVGLAAESIAKHLNRYEPIDIDEAFTAGIMHDIGKLALAGYDPERFDQAAQMSTNTETTFFAAEKDTFAHTRIGEYLAMKWNFPQGLATAIGYHHDPTALSPIDLLTAITHLSDIMVHIIGFQTVDKETIPRFNDDAIAAVHLQPERLRVIGEELVENIERIQSLLDFVS